MAIAELEHLGEGVVPRVQKRKKDHQLNEGARHDTHGHELDVLDQAQLAHHNAAKNGHTVSIEKAVRVQQAAGHLKQMDQDSLPFDGSRGSWIVVTVHQSGRQQEIGELGELRKRIRFWLGAAVPLEIGRDDAWHVVANKCVGLHDKSYLFEQNVNETYSSFEKWALLNPYYSAPSKIRFLKFFFNS